MAEVRRRGRPRIEEPKNTGIRIRMTERELAEIAYLSDQEGISVSDFIREGIELRKKLAKYR